MILIEGVPTWCGWRNVGTRDVRKEYATVEASKRNDITYHAPWCWQDTDCLFGRLGEEIPVVGDGDAKMRNVVTGGLGCSQEI